MTPFVYSNSTDSFFSVRGFLRLKASFPILFAISLGSKILSVRNSQQKKIALMTIPAVMQQTDASNASSAEEEVSLKTEIIKQKEEMIQCLQV